MNDNPKPGGLSDGDILRCLIDGSIKLTPYSTDDAREVLAFREDFAKFQKQQLAAEEIREIDPSHKTAVALNKMLQPASIDVVLDKTITRFNSEEFPSVKPWEEQIGLTYQQIIEQGETFILQPDHFILGSTFEHVTLANNILARFEGKSSLGRIGQATHITAGFVDPGFQGNITVELKNNNELPIELKPGMKIGQFAFERLDREALVSYGETTIGSHYQNQRESTPARFDDFHLTDVYEDSNTNP
ncbi:dCTP deaminase [Candidatus Saccharibacteria bacterium]|nr:dCTP deaminase [Candidatus Saccharibacteria bacterium]